MRITKRFSLALVAGLALGGCSGSGSDVTASPEEANIPDPPQSPSVVITGFVTDMPIPNATVIVTVNGQSFVAPLPTAADGSYEVEIESDDPDALVTAEAFDPNGPVRFTAVIDTFAGVVEEAGDTAASDVNITNVTTAQQVLATRLTTDGSIDTKDELMDVASRVDTEDLLDLSAAIKVVVENIGGVVLPADATDTLDLAEAIVDGATTFLDDVAVMAPDALDTALDLVLTDGNATLEFTRESVPGAYITQDNLSLFVMLPSGFGFNVAHDRNGVAMFDWQVTDAGVLNLYGVSDQGSVESVTLLGRTSDVVNVVVRESESTGAGNPSTAWYRGFEGAFTNDNVPGSYSTLNEPGHLTVFLAGGTGYDLELATGTQSDAFSWMVDADGVLMIADSDGENVSYVRRLAGTTEENLKLLIWEMNAGEIEHAAVIDALRTDSALSAGVSGTDTAFLLAGSTYALTDSDEIALFTFGADGSFKQISQFENDEGGQWDIAEATGAWSYDANGSLTTQFPGDESSEGVQILSGAGDDFMVVQTEADDPTSVLQVLRVVPIEAAVVTGSFTIMEEATGITDGTVELSANFTGTHVSNDGVAENLEWGISRDGRMIIELAGENEFDKETLTFYMLAGSSQTVLRFVAVHRVNDNLRIRDSSTGEDPDTLSLLTFVRMR